MNSYFNSILDRNHLTSRDEIIRWWNNGRGILNVAFIIYTIFHLSIIVVVLHNGWILFLLPYIFVTFVSINILFSVGMLYEIISLQIFKSKINFDKVAPQLKMWEFVSCAILVAGLSIFDILTQ